MGTSGVRAPCHSKAGSCSSLRSSHEFLSPLLEQGDFRRDLLQLLTASGSVLALVSNTCLPTLVCHTRKVALNKGVGADHFVLSSGNLPSCSYQLGTVDAVLQLESSLCSLVWSGLLGPVLRRLLSLSDREAVGLAVPTSASLAKGSCAPVPGIVM